jgi:phosphoglycolate phosphatase
MKDTKDSGIIFDLDGTLWDSAKSVADSWNEVIETYKEINYRMTVEAMKGFMGKTIDEIAELFFYDVPAEKRREIMNKCCIREMEYLKSHGGVLYPKVEETLSELYSNYKLFIVSNCQVGYIEAFLESHSLGKYFSDYENPGRTGKPKGDNIKLVIERNNLSRALYIGDTQGDYNSTCAARIPFIHARYGFGKVEEPVPFVNGFSEIPAKVKELIG